jgi:hypothetical protein
MNEQLEAATQPSSSATAECSPHAGDTAQRASKRFAQCRRLLRGHVRGVALEVLLVLHRLAAKHGGVVWCGPRWIANSGISSVVWARKILKDLIEKKWLVATDYHGRRAYRVRTHAEWAEVTRCENCSLLVPDAPIPEPEANDFVSPLGKSVSPTGNKVSDDRNPPAVKPLKDKGFTNPALAPSSTGSTQPERALLPNGVRRTALVRRSLAENLKSKLVREGETLKQVLEEIEKIDRSDWISKIEDACSFLDFHFRMDDPEIGFGFAATLANVFEKYQEKLKSGDMLPGIFCCKVIDEVLRNGWTFPPRFTEHRNRLRAAEK